MPLSRAFVITAVTALGLSACSHPTLPTYDGLTAGRTTLEEAKAAHPDLAATDTGAPAALEQAAQITAFERGGSDDKELLLFRKGVLFDLTVELATPDKLSEARATLTQQCGAAGKTKSPKMGDGDAWCGGRAALYNVFGTGLLELRAKPK